MGLARQALLWASRNQWLDEQFRRRAFARRAVRRFMPGEDVEAALSAAEQHRERGLVSVFTLLGENIETRQEAENATATYLDLLDRIRDRNVPGQISLKPTQLGLDLGSEICEEQLECLLTRAQATANFVWIDMEDSTYVDRTLDLFEGARSRHDNVGLCIQAYLHRAMTDLEQLLELNAAVRIVKGAYNEPGEVALKRKRDVDESFFRLSTRMLRAVADGGSALPAFATHDLRLLARILDAAASLGVPKDRFEIQMLYGIARDQQIQYAKDGYRMRVLVSYGTAWFPWYMRRLAERPANVGFVVKSLFR